MKRIAAIAANVVWQRIPSNIKEIRPVSEKTDRRGAMVTAMAGVAALATGSVATSAQTLNRESFPVGMAGRGADGHMQVALRILAADDLKPVAGVEVFLTFVGRSGDGGGALETTDNEGIVRFGVWPGPWQVNLTPPKGTRYCKTEFSKIETMLAVQPDGSCFPTQFRIAVRETEWPEMREHVHETK